jgi:hypothetical protein
MPARIAAPPSPNSKASCSPAVPPPPVAGAPVGILLSAGAAVGTLLSAGTGVWLVCAGAVVDLVGAGACPLDVLESLGVDAAEALPVDAGEEAVRVCGALDAGEVVGVPVCVLVDAGDGE